MNIEYKSVNLAQTRFASPDNDTRSFTGYGSVFGVVDSYGDIIAPTAFDKTLAKHKEDGTMPFMFLNHDMFSLPIGRYKSMEADDHGLLLSGELIDTSDGRDTYAAIKSGVVNGLSIGFYIRGYEEVEIDGETHRLITDVELVECSVVTFPANSAARISEVRSTIRDGMSVRELETFLRANGVSRSDAIAVASQFESKSELKRIEDEQNVLNALHAFRLNLRSE